MKINKGSIWKSKLVSDVIILVLKVSVKTNTVTAKVKTGFQYPDTTLSYVLDTFADYFEEETEMVYSRVIFKVEDGDVVAFLLDVPSNYGNVVCYAHVGQHSEASLSYARPRKLAKYPKYIDLARELQERGYYLDIIKKFPSGFVQGN